MGIDVFLQFMDTETIEIAPAPRETGPGFLDEFKSCWQTLSYKGFFFGILAAWLALFHFIGNSTLGYFNNPSLMAWLWDIYNAEASEDGHALLILIAVPVLFWWKRREILAAPQRNWWPGLLIIALALFFHLVGFLIQQPKISVVGMFLGIYGLIGLTWGPRWLKETFYPFVLFAFCVPLAGNVEAITFPLRILATNITYVITHGIFGLPIIKKGTELFDANGAYNYDVAAACSGLRSLIALLALTTVYGMLAFKKNWKRLLVISMAVPLAVVCNVFRLTSIVIAAESFGQNVGNLLHEWSFKFMGKPVSFSPVGLFTYVVAIGGLLLLTVWLRERDPKPNDLEPKTT